MKILIINAGSSSLKFSLYEYEKKLNLIFGTIERIKETRAIVRAYTIQGPVVNKIDNEIKDHKEALVKTLSILTDEKLNIIKSVNEIKAIGHRVVHGGYKFKESVILNDFVLEELKRLSHLAPLHNPVAIEGIEAIKELLPNIPQVLCFDTSWHTTIEEHVFLYAVPYYWYEEYHIRKYGFHGLSYNYVAKRASVVLDKPLCSLNLIILHLGNGASINAVKNGKSYDTSMGMTPLEGLVMGTRSGDLDPSIISIMSTILNKSIDEIENILNKESGILGISGVSNDLRDIWDKIKENDLRSGLAIEVSAYRIKKYIGTYLAALDFKVDAIIFTAGVGETDYGVREKALLGFENIGIEIDEEKNNLAQSRHSESVISTDSSKIKIMIIPTNEELVILEDTHNLISGK